MSEGISDETSLEVQIATVKQEVDALQVEVMSGKRRWYETPATLIALSALVFSFGTTAVSYYRAVQQDVLSSRIELRRLVEKINNIPQQRERMLLEFSGYPDSIRVLSAQMNNRNLFLSRQAAAFIERIENSWFGRGSVTSDEYLSVSIALVSSLEHNVSQAYVEKASKRAKNPAGIAEGLRALAGALMAKGDHEGMERYMQQASEIFSDPPFSDAPQVIQDLTNATTQLKWGTYKVALGDCKGAQSHLERAQPFIGRLGGPIKAELSEFEGELVLGIGNCRSRAAPPQV